MKEIIEVPQAAKELINTPDKWTKGEFARNENGIPVRSYDSDACAFCIEGAVTEAMRQVNPMIGARPCFDELKLTLGSSRALQYWNDISFRTHAEVMELFDNTIERLGNAQRG